MLLLAPSILAGDLADLGTVCDQCEQGGADFLHVDVMDGHFVPNLTFGIPVVRALKQRTKLPLDVHLMVSNPGSLLDDYLDAGADWVSVHWEVATHLDRLVERIHRAGAKAGVALNPATGTEVLSEILPSLDFVLIMSVNPGFAGQSFLPYCLEKARRMSREVAEKNLDVIVAMDGGIDERNIGEVVSAGVRFCVAGSAVFGRPDPQAAMIDLRQQAIGVVS
ncbi:MAG: ribulose-phosphate 3-epimerase [Acidobacteriota bacterium]|nr:ribulose-phosphate 3-epimerase [Acidobacteriota bacterium]